jgi:hypothetical protein
MNAVDIIVIGLVLLALILAVRKIIKQKKSGGCCYGCSGCSSAQKCDAFDTFEAEAREKLNQTANEKTAGNNDQKNN